jgi:hypothetical protein
VAHCSFGLAYVATRNCDLGVSVGSEKAERAEGHPMPEGFREEVMVGCGVVVLDGGTAMCVCVCVCV